MDDSLNSIVNITDDDLARIVVGLVDMGYPITAVRILRNALGCGLKQAKDITDVARTSARSQPATGIVPRVADAIDTYKGI